MCQNCGSKKHSTDKCNGMPDSASESRALLSLLRDKLLSLQRSHLVIDDDGWYSCPASGNCIRDHNGVCNCGAQAQNETILECVEIIKKLADSAPRLCGGWTCWLEGGTL